MNIYTGLIIVFDIAFAIYVVHIFHSLKEEIELIHGNISFLRTKQDSDKVVASANHDYLDHRLDKAIERIDSIQHTPSPAPLPVVYYSAVTKGETNNDTRILLEASYEVLRDIHLKLFDKNINSLLRPGKLEVVMYQLNYLTDFYSFTEKIPE